MRDEALRRKLPLGWNDSLCQSARPLEQGRPVSAFQWAKGSGRRKRTEKNRMHLYSGAGILNSPRNQSSTTTRCRAAKVKNMQASLASLPGYVFSIPDNAHCAEEEALPKRDQVYCSPTVKQGLMYLNSLQEIIFRVCGRIYSYLK
jgi:hypothetical protein